MVTSSGIESILSIVKLLMFSNSGGTNSVSTDINILPKYSLVFNDVKCKKVGPKFGKSPEI